MTSMRIARSRGLVLSAEHAEATSDPGEGPRPGAARELGELPTETILESIGHV